MADQRTRLQLAPRPVDRVSARVVKPARPEHLWQPKPRPAPGAVESDNVLRTAPLPAAAPVGLHQLPGQRRGRLTIIGYAAEQGARTKGAKWVVRCDCGRYEHRTSILRWLGTQADDCCRECHSRQHKLSGYVPSKPPSERLDLRAEVLAMKKGKP